MSGLRRRVPQAMLKVLDDSGLEWSVVDMRRHMAIVLCGRVVQVLPRRGADHPGSHLHNAVACVRRAIRKELSQRRETDERSQ